jgi:hypothetical protein
MTIETSISKSAVAEGIPIYIFVPIKRSGIQTSSFLSGANIILTDKNDGFKKDK